MFSPLILIARKIVKKRVQLKLSQRDVCKLAGCSQSYICQIETGVRTISLSLARKLEVILKTAPGSLRKAEFRRGRPPCRPETRQALLEIAQAEGPSVRPLLNTTPPSHPRPDKINSLENPLWPMAPHLGHQAHLDVVALEKLHPGEENFWRKLNSVPFDSWSEKRLQVRVGLTGAELTGVGLQRVKCVLPVSNGKTGRGCSRARPAFVLKSEGLAMALFPQICVGTSVCHRWPDSLVVASMNGRRQTAVIEIDGDPFHRDTAKDARRSRELDVSVLRIPADQVGEPAIIERILTWLRSLFRGE